MLKDVLHTVRFYKEVYKAIDGIIGDRDKLFLKSWIGLIDYNDGKRRVLNPEEYKGSTTYTLYQKYVEKYDDEFLKRFGIYNTES